MLNARVKVKPPPLKLGKGVGGEAERDFQFREERCAEVGEAGLRDEVYMHHEKNLSKLLREDDLMLFNVHTAASLGMTTGVRYLIERCNVDVNSRNSGNWTPIMYASLFSHDDTLLYLLEMKADINVKNSTGKTPLMLASLCGSEETVRLLLQHGADTEERDNDFLTALMLAIQATHSQPAQLLIEHGANVNAREEAHGQTALYMAAQSGQFVIARALLLKGADAHTKTSSGDSAYHAALRNGYPAIATLITEQQQQQNAARTPGVVSGAVTPHLNPLIEFIPTRFRPKSPYTAFFERYSPIDAAAAPTSVAAPLLQHPAPPRLVIEHVDRHDQWFPHDAGGDADRRSPEGTECNHHPDAFNPLSAWPGTSLIFKQATNKGETKFRRSVTKPHTPPTATTTTTPSTPSTPAAHQAATPATPQVKLPKDLSSLLAELGLAKYQMHFEEQDIDLQVFLTMNETDLREIGINSLGARRKFLSMIEYFQTHTSYYQFSEQFMVNTCVSKSDLINLRLAFNLLSNVLHQLTSGGQNTLREQLAQCAMQVDRFLRKYL